MFGAVVGDIVGSRHEFQPIKTKDFVLLHEDCTYTDDSVLTIAVGEALASGDGMAVTLRAYTLQNVTSYGPHYWDWANGRLGDGPYGSWANGAAMRVSYAAWLARDIDECIEFADLSASATHNHPEGIRSARAVAVAIYAARTGQRARLREIVEYVSRYDLCKSVDELRDVTEFEHKSWISVPRAIVCALEATDFEDAVRNAVSLGGDADTEAAIAGSIAEAMFGRMEADGFVSGVPNAIRDAALLKLPEHLREDLHWLVAEARHIRPHSFELEDLEEYRWDPNETSRWIKAREEERKGRRQAEAAELERMRREAEERELEIEQEFEGVHFPVRTGLLDRMRRWMGLDRL